MKCDTEKQKIEYKNLLNAFEEAIIAEKNADFVLNEARKRCGLARLKLVQFFNEVEEKQ